MQSELSQAIRQLVQERGIPEDLVMSTIENFLLAAYKRKFGVCDNAVVRFSDDGTEVTLFARKKIVLEDDLDDPVYELPLAEAKELNEEAEVGDELLIEMNPKDFDRVSVQSAKQKARQSLREIQKDTLYSEYKDKVGEMIIGYYQRERNGNIYVDLGKTEGILPKKFQSPREDYHPNDRIKAMIYEVAKTPTGLQIILSRNHAEFVKKIFELEVPELYDKTIEIWKIVREPGYRTKLAVRSNREDVDPVGACVGLKGVRIQAVVRELEGEKIDVLRYSLDPRTFIKNSLSPAEVSQVVIVDEPRKNAVAVVPDAAFSLAIGKGGLNVRLANRLTDWNIDVKTETQFAEMDISADARRAVSALFGEPIAQIEKISELPGHLRAPRRHPRARRHQRDRGPGVARPRAARHPRGHHRRGRGRAPEDHRGKRRDRGGGARRRRARRRGSAARIRAVRGGAGASAVRDRCRARCVRDRRRGCRGPGGARPRDDDGRGRRGRDVRVPGVRRSRHARHGHLPKLRRGTKLRRQRGAGIRERGVCPRNSKGRRSPRPPSSSTRRRSCRSPSRSRSSPCR